MQSNLHCIQCTHPFLLSLGIEHITLSLLAPFFADWATGIESLDICSWYSVVRVFMDVECKCNLLKSCAGNAFILLVCHMSVTWRQVRQQSHDFINCFSFHFVWERATLRELENWTRVLCILSRFWSKPPCFLKWTVADWPRGVAA